MSAFDACNGLGYTWKCIRGREAVAAEWPMLSTPGVLALRIPTVTAGTRLLARISLASLLQHLAVLGRWSLHPALLR